MNDHFACKIEGDLDLRCSLCREAEADMRHGILASDELGQLLTAWYHVLDRQRERERDAAFLAGLGIKWL